MKAKKSYGQHFLKDEGVARQIAESLTCTDFCPNVLEIGPGKGMLTQFLLEKSFNLHVVEADPDMVCYLEKNFPQLENHLIAADFLKWKPETVFSQSSFALIGNFPYNISSQIVFKMLEYHQQVPEMVGMFQLEMAERIIAPPGTKAYGVISVLTQAYYTGELLFTLEEDAFDPPPKVKSAVIRLTHKEDNTLGCEYRELRIVVKQAFSQRRKMLRNTMKSFIKGDPILEDPLFSRRPEQLSLEEFVSLTNLIRSKIEKTQDH